MARGNGPCEKLLPLAPSTLSLVSRPISGGMSPVSRLKETSSTSSLVSRPIPGGMLPVKRLPQSERDWSHSSRNSSEGIAPVRPFPSSNNSITFPSASVVTPCQSARGASLNQLVASVHSGPPVRLNSATNAARSGASGPNPETVTSTLADTSTEEAVIRALPFDCASRTPAEFTETTRGSLLAQTSCAFGTRWPFLSFAAASTRRAPSVFVSVTLAGASSMRATVCDTVTAAVAWNCPETAVTTAEPFFRAVTRPSSETVATSVFPLVHVTAAFTIARSFPSRTDAVNCTIAPIASSSASAGDTVMPAARGGSVGLSLPHVERTMTERTSGTRRNLMARLPLRDASRIKMDTAFWDCSIA